MGNLVHIQRKQNTMMAQQLSSMQKACTHIGLTPQKSKDVPAWVAILLTKIADNCPEGYWFHGVEVDPEVAQNIDVLRRRLALSLERKVPWRLAFLEFADLRRARNPGANPFYVKPGADRSFEHVTRLMEDLIEAVS